MTGDYAPFVIAAYAIAFGTVAALLLWAAAGRRGARRALERAERAAKREGGR